MARDSYVMPDGCDDVLHVASSLRQGSGNRLPPVAAVVAAVLAALDAQG
jgi:hypothetical protein